MNELGYGQLSNSNPSLKLILMRVGNHWELLLWYFHYLGQGSHCISFQVLISSNVEGGWSHLDHTVVFVDFMSYPIYDVLNITWLGIPELLSKHDHPSTRYLWCLNSKDHIHNYDMNKLDWQLGIIPFRDSYGSIQWTLSPKSTHNLSLVSLHRLL